MTVLGTSQAALCRTQLGSEAGQTQPGVPASPGPLPAQGGWNQGDLIPRSRRVSVEGEVTFLSTPVPGSSTGESITPSVAFQRDGGLFHSASLFPGGRRPITPALLRLSVGLGRHREEGSEFRGHNTAAGKPASEGTQALLIRVPHLGRRSQGPGMQREVPHDPLLVSGSVSGRMAKTEQVFSQQLSKGGGVSPRRHMPELSPSGNQGQLRISQQLRNVGVPAG